MMNKVLTEQKLRWWLEEHSADREHKLLSHGSAQVLTHWRNFRHMPHAENALQQPAYAAVIGFVLDAEAGHISKAKRLQSMLNPCRMMWQDHLKRSKPPGKLPLL